MISVQPAGLLETMILWKTIWKKILAVSHTYEVVDSILTRLCQQYIFTADTDAISEQWHSDSDLLCLV